MAGGVQVSVVATLAFPRARPVECLASWTKGQDFPQEEIELIVATDGRRPALDRQVAGALRPSDRMLTLPGYSEMELYAAGAGAARGRWLLFTEAHCLARPDCVRELVAHAIEHGLAGACVRTLPGRDGSRVARMEARMYREAATGWNDDSGIFTKRGVLLARAAYEEAGGLDTARRRYSETAILPRLHERGHRIGYARTAGIAHQNSTSLSELLGYVWEYRRQEGGRPPPPSLAGLRAPRPALAVLRSRLSFAAAAARRFAHAWLGFRLAAGDEERSYAAYSRLWESFGELSVALERPRLPRELSRATVYPVAELEAAELAGFHAVERANGVGFRWTGPVAMIRFERRPPPRQVVLDVLGIRALDGDQVHAYWNDERLTHAGRFAFAASGRSEERVSTLTLVCPRLDSTASSETRRLGLPLVSVELR